MANRVKAAWRDGRTTLNGWLAIPNAFSAEIYAQGGWDSVTVDMQHGIQDYLSVVSCFQGMQGSGVLPMVRVPWNEPGIIGKVLDAGAMGVICPMVNSAEEARRFVAACRYPPQGHRSNGPIRAGIPGRYEGSSYQASANDEVLCLPMIETREAVDDMEAILDIPGVDGFYVGPSDLGFSLGLRPVLDREEDEILRIYERLVSAAKSRGLGAGVHCSAPAYARRMLALGFSWVTVDTDAGLLASAARAAVSAARG